MRIGTREVGPGHPTFIIAECGSNHGGSLDAAIALIDAAADAGADAAKFQYFRVDRFLVPREKPESLRRYELPTEWLAKLRQRCDEREIEFLCTAFDLTSLEWVKSFVSAIKVGSWEQRNTDMVRYAKVRWPESVVIASGGIGWQMESFACDIRLACVSEYPASTDHYLPRAQVPSYAFPIGDAGARGVWGISDHTLDPITVPAVAVTLGASVVEKHMRLWGADDETPDYPVSIDEIRFADMVDVIRKVERCVR